MYRDDATALGEQGAALEEQLATLRAAGPPGAVARIAELRAEQRALRRFGWAFAWLAGIPLLWLASHVAGFAVARAFVLGPPALTLVHLWLELGRQRRITTQRRRELARRTKLEDAGHAASPAAIAPVSQPVTADLSALVVHQDDLARELAVYRASGTQDQALDAELTRRSDDLGRHGRPFLWLAAALLVAVMPATKEEPFDLLPVIIGSMTLALVSFAARMVTHGRQLAARLEIAGRELQRAERLVGSSLAAETVDTTTETLRARTDVARRTRQNVERLRDHRDQHVASVWRAGIAVFACLIGLVAELTGKGTLSSGSFIIACLIGLFALAALFFGAKSAAAIARTGRNLRVAELEANPAEEHLHRLRETPRARVELEARLDEELPSSARYDRRRELP